MDGKKLQAMSVVRTGRNKWAGWLLQDQYCCRSVMASAALQVTETRRESVLLQVLLNTDNYPPEWKSTVKKKIKGTRYSRAIKQNTAPGTETRSKGNKSHQAVPLQGSDLAKTAQQHRIKHKTSFYRSSCFSKHSKNRTKPCGYKGTEERGEECH